MATDATIVTLRDAAARWSAGFGNAAAVVRAACDVLAAGHGGMAMAMLAGVHLRQADAEAPELFPEALAEVGLPFMSRGDEAGQEYWLAAMARSVLTGAISPRELTAWAHRMFGHAGLDSAQCLVALDDEYDDAYAMSQYYRRRVIGVSDLDAEVIAEARRLVNRASLGDASTTTD